MAAMSLNDLSKEMNSHEMFEKYQLVKTNHWLLLYKKENQLREMKQKQLREIGFFKRISIN